MNAIKRSALRMNRIYAFIASSKAPVTSTEIYQNPDVNALCNSQSNIQDSLGNLHRTGRILRLPKEIRYGKAVYTWMANRTAPAVMIPRRILELYPTPTPPVPTTDPVPTSKPHITVTEHLVTIELDTIKITVEV